MHTDAPHDEPAPTPHRAPALVRVYYCTRCGSPVGASRRSVLAAYSCGACGSRAVACADYAAAPAPRAS